MDVWLYQRTPRELTQTEIVARLRECAAGRREYLAGYAESEPNPVMREQRRTLEIEALTLEAAVKIAEGDASPLYGLLPSWRWSPEMEAEIGLGKRG